MSKNINLILKYTIQYQIFITGIFSFFNSGQTYILAGQNELY
ncbi:putative membrane protein [[Clostridium] bifermentans ATCC 638]|uniref:Putative membrane protein n=1 Tax=Paraclostridium bifermentans ATCC 638 = DSM 14991 TaxID=1233171 RepID=T4VGU7_PARBF|nr:putative membrane protein [[Clostridium] bifermentans ATCC 638] [Paraclostridium bifermentans ATCC 638 = DSM 14991]